MKSMCFSILGDLDDMFLGFHGVCAVIEFVDQCRDICFPEGADVLFLGWSGVVNRSAFEKSSKLSDIGVDLSGIHVFSELIALDENNKKLFLVAFYENGSLFSEAKKQSMDEVSNQCDLEKVYITVFPDRNEFSKVADQIAWGTKVWIANEPNHMIHYDDKPVIQAR